MRKSLTMQIAKNYAFAIAAVLFSPLTEAEDILGLFIEVGTWNAQLTNSFLSTAAFPDGDDDTAAVTPTSISTHTAQVKEDAQLRIGIALEHELPLIPNIRYRQTDLSANGQFSPISTINFVDTSFEAQTTLTANLDLGYQEITAYYPVFDEWIRVDVGVTSLSVDGAISLTSRGSDTGDDGGEGGEDTETSQIEATASLENSAILLFTLLEFEIPRTPFSISHETSYHNSGDEDLSGRETKLRYRSSKNAHVQLEAGYKKQKFISATMGDIDSTLYASGSYLAISIVF